MEPEEIKDRESLKAWIEGRPKDTRQADAVAIATRTGLRVFPLWSGAMNEVWARVVGDTALPIIRQLLTSAVARNWPNRESRAAATAAGFYSHDNTYEAALPATHLAAKAAFCASDASAASAAARAATVSSADAANFAARAAKAAVESVFDVTDVMWEQVSKDATMIRDGSDPVLAPLWSKPHPDWFEEMDQKARAIWAADPATWSFWLRWWDGVLSGQQVDWELQKQVALIPDEVWRQGPVALAEAIAEIETRYALAATDNAEVIEENPETGKLHLVPTSALPSDLGEYARRKILKAVELFDDPGATQQYRAIAPDLDMLRRAEADAGNLPVELYDACASATRRLAMRAEGGECPPPEKDPQLADYRNRLMDVAADILAHDPMTQDVLDRRNRIKGNTALIDGRVTLNIAVQIVLPGTEGRLADTLPQDGTLATDPQANPEDRKDASVRLAGRLLRIMVWMMKHPVKGAASIVVAGGLAQVGVRGADWIIDSASPQTVETLKAAWEIILRYLGL